MQHLVHTAGEEVEEGHGVGLTAGLPRRHGNHNPAGQRVERARAMSLTGETKKTGGIGSESGETRERRDAHLSSRMR